jgi:ribosomal protein S27AE
MTTVALATTLEREQRFCPVCGDPVAVQQPVSTNSAGGQDRDLLQRAHGAQVFMEVVATCGSCGFTGWPADFDEQRRSKRERKRQEGGEPGSLTAGQAQAIRDGALQRPAALAEVPYRAEAPYGDLPSWARLDMLAQTVALRGGEADRVADLKLQAAWAVRMGYHPVHLRQGDPDETQRDWLFAKLSEFTEQAAELGKTNPADIELWVAVRLLTGAERYSDDLRCLSGTYGASLLRSHGEHAALLEALPSLEDCVPSGSWEGKAQAVRDSVELERSYQRQARDAFVEVLDAGGLEADDAALTTYLVGELSRRVGEPEQARGYLDRAATMTAPEGLDLWIRQQRCLLDQEDAVLGLLLCHGDLPPPAAPAALEPSEAAEDATP